MMFFSIASTSYTIAILKHTYFVCDYYYPATEELKALNERYQWCIFNGTDWTLYGILADYLTDHRSELLLNATGPSDPAVRLDQLIDWLRSRFNSQFDQ